MFLAILTEDHIDYTDDVILEQEIAMFFNLNESY
jgi:hypothetical protein